MPCRDFWAMPGLKFGVNLVKCCLWGVVSGVIQQRLAAEKSTIELLGKAMKFHTLVATPGD